MALHATFVAALAARGGRTDGNSGTRTRSDINRGRRETIPSHMVWSATPVAFDGGQSRGIEPTTRWGSARSEGPLTPGEPGAVPGEMADTTTVIALGGSTGLLKPQAWAFGLNVADAPAGVALLLADGARRCASRRFMAGLAAVVAQSLLRRATLGDMAKITTFEAAFSGNLESHLLYCIILQLKINRPILHPLLRTALPTSGEKGRLKCC